MSIYEYDEVKHMLQTRREDYGDGCNNEYDNGFRFWYKTIFCNKNQRLYATADKNKRLTRLT